jgi:polyketide biosynthesis acyl carrier protein
MTDQVERVRLVLLDVLTEILPHLPGEEVSDDKSLRDLGADSVDRVEIISELTRRLGRDDPLSEFAEIPDLGALVAHLSGSASR